MESISRLFTSCCSTTNLSSRLLGIGIIFGIVLSWVGSAEFANFAERYTKFDQPFFLVYFNNCWNVLIFPLFFAWRLIVDLWNNRGVTNPLAFIAKALEEDKISQEKLVLTAFISTINLCLADYLYFRALSITSASSGLVIFNISSVFTYFLSLFLLREPFSVIKLSGVIATFGGAALIAFSDKFVTLMSSQDTLDQSTEWIGDLVMAGGALFWGFYLVCYKKFIGEPGYTTINVQSGLVGIINLAFLWPLFIALHYSGLEVFRWPRGLSIEMVITTSVLVFINNYLFTFGAAVTSPIFVTIGGMLSIPTIVLVDWILHGIVPSVYKIVGTLVVALGFVLVNIEFDCFPSAKDLCHSYCPECCHPLCCCYRTESDETPTEEYEHRIADSMGPFLGYDTPHEGRELKADIVGINYASTTDVDEIDSLK